MGEREVHKEFVADHEAEAEREWACLTLLAEHAPGLAPRPLTTVQTEALGAALRRLYGVPVGAVRDAGIGPRVARLVDFEDGGLSDPAYELADHVEHLGSRLPSVYDARALADAVGSMRRDASG
jgi:hypothetical protein